ncbi:MAG: hypothetical protein M8861_10805 [marine benthic group bacterium]|nr:hypothetical protein [Gemmatimonadota bacterium]
MRSGTRAVRSIIAISTWVVLASACDPGSDFGATVERSTEDGVERVAVRGPDTPLDWSFEARVTISPEVDGDVRFMEVSPWEVGADREGRVYVLDGAGGRVVVFGGSGSMVGSMGRPGQGPGELSQPTALAVSADGEVAVHDYGTGGIARWGPSGELPPLERLDAPFWGPELGLTSWGLLYPSLAADGREGRIVRLVVKAETRTGTLGEMAQTTVAASFPSCGLGGVPVEPIFAPQLHWALGGDIVALVTGPRYEVEVFRSGVLERRISRVEEPRPATRELALQEVAGGYELTAPVRCRISPTELVEARGFAPVVPAISGLAVAPDGTLWVRRGRVNGEPEPAVDVYGADGAYTGTLPPGSPFPVAFAGRATAYRVVSLEPTDTGTIDIVLYEIVR